MAKRKKPGRNGDRLKLDGDWKDAMRTAVQKPKPADGWPNRATEKRKPRKKK